jgi:hypothetical protein
MKFKFMKVDFFSLSLSIGTSHKIC